MTLLFDAHDSFGAIGQPENLSGVVRLALENPENQPVVSVTSLWEIALKVQFGKLDLPVSPSFYREHLQRFHASLLPVEARHTFELMRLPLLHRDPFDRLLVAQARTDQLTLRTCGT
ncbi:MAG: type II toxin-antitoxin system VapC family toxin [Acidobacteriota bacterium]|nr:type II toxin-antitoxin system VapC family toxin [Bryobacteraceae bacterium CoA2 C42]